MVCGLNFKPALDREIMRKLNSKCFCDVLRKTMLSKSPHNFFSMGGFVVGGFAHTSLLLKVAPFFLS